MIAAISGSICSGKESLANYLVTNFNFKAVNIYKDIAEELNIDVHDKVKFLEAFHSGKPLTHFSCDLFS